MTLLVCLCKTCWCPVRFAGEFRYSDWPPTCERCQQGDHRGDRKYVSTPERDREIAEYMSELAAKGRYRPCSKCGNAPAIHNPNLGPDFIGHEYA